MRRWLPPVCLLAVIAVVWALPYRPHCAALAWDDDPAIARVGGECVRLSDYAGKLRIVESGIEYAERKLLPDDPNFDDWRVRHERVMSYGPETVALADVIEDSALYQRAVAEGHGPTDEEMAIVRDRERQRTEGGIDFIELARLAKKSDLAGFKALAEKSQHPDIKTALETGFLPELMASLERLDMRGFEKSFEDGEAYLEYVGRELYWNEIRPAKLRREISADNLEKAVLDAIIEGSIEGSIEEVPRLAWLDYKREVLDGTDVKLTDAAPPTVSVKGARAYLSEFLKSERDALNEEYRKRIGRREERRRLTPPPPSPNTN